MVEITKALLTSNDLINLPYVMDVYNVWKNWYLRWNAQHIYEFLLRQ